MGKEVIAVDIGGTNLRVALVKGNKITKYLKEKTPKDKNSFVKKLLSMISSLMNRNVGAIGVSSAGPMKDGIIKNPPNLPFKSLNLKKIIKDKFHKRVEVENDAACVALAEARLGYKKRNFFILTLGTGIGGGMILDGKIESGEGYGGELGHIYLDEGKDFEEVWQDIRKRYRREFGNETLIKDLFNKKNRKSRKFLEELSDCLGQGVASLIAVFDPEIVVLAGGVRETGTEFLNMIHKKVKRYNKIPRTPPIKWTKLEHPGILGAGLLIH